MRLKQIFIFVISYIVIMSLLLYRFINLYYIESSKVIFFSSIWILLGIVLTLSLYFYKDFINPVTLYSPFILFYSLSSVSLTYKELPLSVTTHMIILLSIFSYFFGLLIPVKIKSKKQIRFTLKNRKYIFFIIYIFIVLTFVLEIKRFGYIPIFKVFTRDVYSETEAFLLPFLHNFIILIPVFVIWTYLFFKLNAISKVSFLFILGSIIFIQLNYFSRQYLFWLTINIIVLFNFFRKKKSVKKVLFFLFFLFFVFYIFGLLRVSSQVKILNSQHPDTPPLTINAYLNDLAESKYELSTIEASFVGYTTQSYSRLEYLVRQVKEKNFWGCGKYTFYPVSSLFMLEELGVVSYNDFEIPEFFIPTYSFVVYADFGFLGIILLNILYGVIVKHSYSSFKEGKYSGISFWAIAAFFLLMTPFINYFHTFIIWLSWLLTKILFLNNELK